MSYRLSKEELRIIERTKSPEAETEASPAPDRPPVTQLLKPYLVFAGILVVIVVVFSAVILITR